MSSQYESVIKTAPPVRQLDFPKTEPLELAPLTQDITSKMADFNQPYGRYADYGNSYLVQQPTAIVSGIPNIQYYHINELQDEANLNQFLNQYTLPSHLHDATIWQTNSYGDAPGYATPSQASAASAPRAYDAEVRGSSILYKSSVDMPSPDHAHHSTYSIASQSDQVDSGIGAELSMITPKQEDYFGDGCSLERPERTLSHRDSPVIIPKLHNTHGFQYVLEAPISTSIRKEDDRMTYVNKGQFYTVTLDYLPEPGKPLKSHNGLVKSQMLVVFREDKTYEEEIKTWKCWHSRQHSAKQRILEVDAKNSSGLAHGTQIEEVGHNCIQFWWNPEELRQSGMSVKISVAIQCLSTDFSNQKGVKGLPLHLQVDTYDSDIEGVPPFHRGYCQVKVFCDKGAERKLRDEDKRAAKRKATGDPSSSNLKSDWQTASEIDTIRQGRKKSDGEYHDSCDKSEFYHMRELDKPAAVFRAPDEFEHSVRFDELQGYDMDTLEPTSKRPRTSERVMLYIRKPTDTIFTPLHIVPPTVAGLAHSLCVKFGVEGAKIKAIYKRCLKGVTVEMDDDMLKLYSNEDLASVEIDAVEDGSYAIYLNEEREPPSLHFAQQPSQ